MAGEFQVEGQNPNASFALYVYRGEGMALLAMNWMGGTPPDDFVGFAIEYKEPAGQKFFPLKNRLGFAGPDGNVDPNRLSTRQSPIQKFRWVHFPRNADMKGLFVYRVTPVFMNAQDELSYGETQEAAIELMSDTYPGKLNVAFTRGFVSSQAFVDNYESQGPISELIPAKADEGLDFTPTHPLAAKALDWMGFEARRAILAALDAAALDATAKVRVVAYDLNQPDVVSRLEALGNRLRIIIDDDGTHGHAGSAETVAAARLADSAGAANVKREHMGKLQHNKIIVVDGKKKVVVCGSTNFSWRAFFVQSNNAMVIEGAAAVQAFGDAFESYWKSNAAGAFGATPSAQWRGLGLAGIDANVAFSPHAAGNALLDAVAHDLGKTASSLFYSLAFLYQTPGPILDAINKVTADDKVFVYGISDRKVGGIDLQKPDGNVAPVYPSELSGNLPEPFKSEPVGGGGVRMHHKFLVIDFNTPAARVYLGSYNFSDAADTKNGENLLVVRDRRVAVAYAIEALRIFDHYHFRVLQDAAKKAHQKLTLARPPRKPHELPWWSQDYSNARKVRDRELFAPLPALAQPAKKKKEHAA